MLEFIDIGCNLTHDSFNPDRPAVIERGLAAGVSALMVTGADLAGSRRAAELAAAHPALLYGTAGVHPHHASEWSAETAAAIEELTNLPKIVAVGECGLDYFRDLAPRDAQLHAFTEQLEIAVRTAKPVFLHQRAAHRDFVAVLKDYVPRLSGGVAHCFTDHAAELADYLDMGLAIGITGWISDERRGRHLWGLAATIPEDRLMIETDAPYLLPRDLKPKPRTRRNEPMYLPHIAQALARARGDSVEHVAQITARNARRLFKLK